MPVGFWGTASGAQSVRAGEKGIAYLFHDSIASLILMLVQRCVLVI